MHRADVRVVERRGRPRLLLEAADAVRVGCEPGGQHFDRHGPPEARVAGAVHLAHAPRADARLDLVRSEPNAPGERLAPEGLGRTSPPARPRRRAAFS